MREICDSDNHTAQKRNLINKYKLHTINYIFIYTHNGSQTACWVSLAVMTAFQRCHHAPHF